MEETITSPQLKALPSYEFYQKLINEKNLNDVNNFCSDVLNTYTKDPWTYKLCGQLIKNVELLRDDSDDTFRKKHCFDINYWLYDEVYKKLKSTDKESDFQGIINLFDVIWKKFTVHSYSVKNGKEVCFPNKTLFRDNFLPYIKQVKNFLDYIENYNFIKGEIGKSTYYACQTYFDYLKERIPLFFSFEPLCRKLGSNICTDYIQGYFLYDPRRVFTNYELSKLYFQSWWNPCYKKVLDVFYDFQKSPTEFIARYNQYVLPFSNNPSQQKVNLAHGGEVKPPSAAANLQAGAVKAAPVDVEPQAVTAQPTRITVPLTSETVTIATDTVQTAEIPSEVHSDDGILSRLKNEQGFPLIKIATCGFLSVLLITMLISALSKFTPLGNLFSRKRKRIKRDFLYNNYPVDGDSILGSYDRFSTSSDESGHSIAYTPM